MFVIIDTRTGRQEGSAHSSKRCAECRALVLNGQRPANYYVVKQLRDDGSISGFYSLLGVL